MRQLRWASQPLSMANTELRMMLGGRRLSEDGWTAMLMVLDAIDGDILAVRKGARKLRRSGKGVDEVLAAVKDRKHAGRGPLHMAAWAGRLEMCKFLFKDLRIDVNTVGYDDTCEIAELLLSRGAYVDPICRKGTPLLVAAQSGNDPVFGENDGCALEERGDTALEENDGCALKEQGDASFESMVLKMQGDAAFEENAYADALALYTKVDPDDSTLYKKRSLCWLHLSDEEKALHDANTYKAMEIDLSNSCYEQAAALILTKCMSLLLVTAIAIV
ncbi:hypothetical protein ACQ4PT_068224 [Festuca glaucescens]